MRNGPSHPVYLNEGLGPKKTAFIIITVVGCVAILWPKVFHPMMFGTTPPKTTTGNKDHRLPGGCCDVVLDREQFLNSTPFEVGPQLYRKQLNLLTGELSIRQERPSHLHPESIYQSMKERGRAIPATPTVPIIERSKSASNPPPRIVEGRPGPIPGMRPPMGAGSVHQAQPKGSSMGLIMPLYTIGIIVFFVYTVMKIVFKKPLPNAPYGPAPNDPNFRKEIFGHDKKIDDLNGSKLVVTAIQGLIDAADEQLKVREKKPTSDSNKETNDTTIISNNGNIANGRTNITESEDPKFVEKSVDETPEAIDISTSKKDEPNSDIFISKSDSLDRKKRDGSVDRSVAVLGLEVTASCEGGQKWSGRPPTPVFLSHPEHSNENFEDPTEPQSIYLEGSLGHDSQILVADSETRTEEVFDKELNGSPEEPAVVLSSKMTLSLINLDGIEGGHQDNEKTPSSDLESPLADDIEIIGHDEK